MGDQTGSVLPPRVEQSTSSLNYQSKETNKPDDAVANILQVHLPEGATELRAGAVNSGSGICGVQLPFLLPKPRASEARGIRMNGA